MLTLYPDQEVAAAFLRSRPLALLCDDMGVGKTGAGLGAIESGRGLVLKVPACLRFKWQADLELYRPGEWAVHHVEHLGDFRWPRLREAVIISPEIVPSTKGEIARAKSALKDSESNTEGVLDFARRVDPAAAKRKLERLIKTRGVVDDPPAGLHVLGDEVHEDSNNKAAQTTRLRSLYRLIRKRGGIIHGLTATPVLNDPMELRGLLTTYGLHVEAFGSWFDYLRAWGGHKGPFAIEWGEPDDELVAEGLRRVSMRRLLRDVRPDMPALLPPEILHVDLDQGLADLQAQAETDLARRGADLWAYMNEPGQRPKKGQETSRIAFEWISRLDAALSACKVPAALRVVEKYERMREPLLVGCAHVPPMKALGARPGWEVLTGETPAKKRHAIVQAWKRGELRGVAASIRAGGVGIDLQAARAVAPVLMLGPDFVPAWTRQFIARRWRTGQTCPVLPIFLRADHPLETRKLEIVKRKRRLYEAVDASALRPAGAVA